MNRIAIDLKASTGETDDETLFQVLLETLFECHVEKVHRHFISVCYVSGTKRIGIKRIAA